MDALTEVLVNVASQSPIIAILLYIMWRDRQDYNARIEDKNELINKYRERDWERISRLETSNRTN